MTKLFCDICEKEISAKSNRGGSRVDISGLCVIANLSYDVCRACAMKVLKYIGKSAAEDVERLSKYFILGEGEDDNR